MAKVTFKVTEYPNADRDVADVVICVDGVKVADGGYGGEPEDNRRCRDYAWIEPAVKTIVERLGHEFEVVEETEEA